MILVHPDRRVLAMSAIVIIAGLPAIIGVLKAPAARAAEYANSWYGNVALNWAESHATGDAYSYGAAGPGAYDCSGLVMTAFEHAGITLPHSTYAMLSNPHLHPVPLSQIQRGDILFYGSGHVEFATVWYHTSFGAHDYGSPVGWIQWGYGWYPTMAFEVY